jgi:DNA-binding transcriptional regulator YiaG
VTPYEFKNARLSLTTTSGGRMTEGKMATVLNVNKRTLQYWESDDGKRPPHPTAVRVMQWFLAGYRPPEWPV